MQTPFQPAEEPQSAPGSVVSCSGSSCSSRAACTPRCVVVGFDCCTRASSLAGQNSDEVMDTSCPSTPPLSRQPSSSLGPLLRQHSAVQPLPGPHLTIKTRVTNPGSTNPRSSQRGTAWRRPEASASIGVQGKAAQNGPNPQPVALRRQRSSNIDIPAAPARLQRAQTWHAETLPTPAAMSEALALGSLSPPKAPDTLPARKAAPVLQCKPLGMQLDEAVLAREAAWVKLFSLHSALCESREEASRLRGQVAAAAREWNMLSQKLVGR